MTGRHGGGANPAGPAYDAAAEARAIAAVDPLMAAFIERAGPITLRSTQDAPFTALVRSIVYQQLAGRAAAAIYERLRVAVGGTILPAAVMDAPDAALRGAGLSAAKAAAVRDLATRTLDGRLPLDGSEDLTDGEITDRLLQVRGIGPWTAHMFLLFELRRPDVWPVGDLAVRNGYAMIFGLDRSPTEREMGTLGDRFRPHRTALAWYCWEAVHLSRSA